MARSNGLGIPADQVVNEIITKAINNDNKTKRTNELKDTKELLDYQYALQCGLIKQQQMVDIRHNININLNIDSNMTPELLESLLYIINNNDKNKK